MSGTTSHPPAPVHIAHKKPGGAIRAAEKDKNDTYKQPAEYAGYRFVPLVLETYGRMGKKFVDLLKDAAKLEAERGQAYVPAAGRDDDGRPAGTLALRAFILRRNMARISAARIRAITRRIIGSTVRNSGRTNVHPPRNTGVEYATQPRITDVGD